MSLITPTSLLSPQLIRQRLNSGRNRFLLLALLVAIAYIPTWLRIVGTELIHGSSYVFINFGFLYLGVREILKYRKHAEQLENSKFERLFGYFLIVCAALLIIPLYYSSSLQAALFALAVLGSILCTFGVRFFLRYKLTSVLLFISFYPDLMFLTYKIRLGLTGTALEELMAWLSSLSFQIFGQVSHADGVLLFLDSGSVKVAPGCSGADMAIPIAGMAIVMGILFNQSYRKIAALTIAGIALSLIFNVPRVMLLTVAIVHWGQESFDFWHGPWGGQIFSGVLFTVYYYLFMWIADIDAPKASS